MMIQDQKRKKTNACENPYIHLAHLFISFSNNLRSPTCVSHCVLPWKYKDETMFSLLKSTVIEEMDSILHCSC